MPAKNLNSKYDLRVNPVYQVDWNQEASGKRVKATKRRVRFRFGFSHRESIEQGLTGQNCRGEEHEVILIWSLTSGKRLVVADGEEIHFSTGKFTDPMFETSWQIQGGHIIKIIAYAAPPMFPQPGFRQFDLQIDGMSFFDMPKIFELGVTKGVRQNREDVSDSRSTNGFALPAPTDYSENNRRPIESTRSYTSYPEYSVPQPSAYEQRSSLPDIPSTPVPPTTQPQEPSPAYYAPTQLQEPAPAYYTPTQPQEPAPAYYASQMYHAPTTPAPVPPSQASYDIYEAPPTRDEFAPVAPPPPTFADKSQQILSAYTSPPPESVLQLANAPHYLEYGNASPGATSTDVSDYEDDSSPYNTPEKAKVLKPTMAPLTIVEMEEREMQHMDEVEKAMKTLVNLGDLTRVNDTPEQVKANRRKEEQRRSNTVKSTPAPPAAASWQVGANAALGDLQKHKPTKETKKEVMKTHSFDLQAAQAGMMIIYGASPAQQGSLPPPNQGTGAGFQQQQQGFRYRQMPQQYTPSPPIYMAH